MPSTVPAGLDVALETPTSRRARSLATHWSTVQTKVQGEAGFVLETQKEAGSQGKLTAGREGAEGGPGRGCRPGRRGRVPGPL